MSITPLQRRVLDVLIMSGPDTPLTAAEIGERIGESGRSVSQACCWLRGGGWVSDGSQATAVAGGIAHTDAPSPVKWSYLAERSQAPLNRVFHGEPVEPLTTDSSQEESHVHG